MNLLYYYASEITYLTCIRTHAVFEFVQSLGARISNWAKISILQYFFAKIIPLTKDSIVESTIFGETYYRSGNSNRADLKLSENECNSNFNTSKVINWLPIKTAVWHAILNLSCCMHIKEHICSKAGYFKILATSKYTWYLYKEDRLNMEKTI